MIARTENKVRVEGHTDDIPVQTSQYENNWELSAARATNVVRFFAQKRIVPESRFSAAGYGSNHPIASNRFTGGREKNRRISLVFVGPIQPLGGELGTGN